MSRKDIFIHKDKLNCYNNCKTLKLDINGMKLAN